MRKFQLPPISRNNASISILGMVLIGPLYLLVLPFAVIVLSAIPAWHKGPTRFWRPFTVASFVFAVLATIWWVNYYGWGLLTPEPAPTTDYAAALRAAINHNSDDASELLIYLANYVGAYVIFSLAMMPHTLARFVHTLTHLDASPSK